MRVSEYCCRSRDVACRHFFVNNKAISRIAALPWDFGIDRDALLLISQRAAAETAIFALESSKLDSRVSYAMDCSKAVACLIAVAGLSRQRGRLSPTSLPAVCGTPYLR